MPGWNLNRVEAAFAEAAVDPSLWTKALDVATAETQAFGAILLPARGDALPNVPCTVSVAPSADTYFRDGWYLRDERYKGMPALLKTGIADDFDAMGLECMRRHPFYQEFLAPHGLRWYAGIRVSCGEELWILSIQRSIHQQPFSPEEKGHLIRLAHSLPTSIAIARLLGAASGSNALDAFELSQTAAVLIDRHGRVLRPNQSAERILRGDVRICGGRIVATDASATAALDRALHQLLFGHDRAGLASPVKLPRIGQRPLPAQDARQKIIPLVPCLDIVNPLISGLTYISSRVFGMIIDLSSFGQAVLSARKEKELAQKELAALIRKEDGEAITPQYLNDIEHDRRSPTSDHLIKQFSKVLGINANLLYSTLGMIPEEDRKLIRRATPQQVGEAYAAFRKQLKG